MILVETLRSCSVEALDVVPASTLQRLIAATLPSFALPFLAVAARGLAASHRSHRRLLGMEIGGPVLRRVSLQPFKICGTTRQTPGHNIAKHRLRLLDRYIRFA